MEIREQVIETLKEVMDPELGISVWDLGLIYNLDIDSNNNVQITMTLTTPGCPLHDSIVSGVRGSVEYTSGTGNVDVKVVWEPAWSPERMNETALRILRGEGYK